LKRGVNYLLSLILSGVFLYIAFYGVDLSEVLEHISHASLFWIFIFILISLISHLIRAYRWKVILHSVKPDIKLKNLFGSLMVGYGVNNVIPRFGEITRAILIGRWENLSRSSMFGAVIVERLIDMVFLGLAVLLSIIIWSDDLALNFPWLKTAVYITMISLLAAVIFIVILIKKRDLFSRIINKTVGKFSATLSEKISHVYDMLLEGFASLKGAKNYAITIILSMLMFFAYALGVYAGFYTVGLQDIQHVNLKMAWVLMSISAIGIVIPTPGGTGSYHTLAKSALVLLFGFEEVIALSFAVLTHFINYFLLIFAAVISFLVLNKRHENLFKVVDTEVDEL
jgi:glycosyltransferase 2 family protein